MRLLRPLALSLAVVACAFTPAAHADFSPALIGDGPRSMAKLIKYPKKLPPGRYAVYCEGFVLSTGVPHRFACYTREGEAPLPLITAVSRAGRQARFIPARENGEPVDVFLLLRALIRVEDGWADALVVPNIGVESDKFGIDYVAPQRLSRTNFSEFSRTDRDLLIVMRLLIDENGKIQEHSLQDMWGANARKESIIKREIKRMRFGPGMYKGRAVPMWYVEPFMVAHEFSAF